MCARMRARACVCVHMSVFVCARTQVRVCVRASACVNAFTFCALECVKCPCVYAGTSSRLLRRQMGGCSSLRHFNPRHLGRTHTTRARDCPALCSDQASDGRVLTQVLDADVRLQTRVCVVGSALHAEKVRAQWMHCPFSRSRHSAKHSRACDHTRVPVLYRRRSPIL